MQPARSSLAQKDNAGPDSLAWVKREQEQGQKKLTGSRPKFRRERGRVEEGTDRESGEGEIEGERDRIQWRC